MPGQRPSEEIYRGAVGGLKAEASTEMTRPSDTTAYTAGDVISNSTSATTPIELQYVTRASGVGGYIVGCRIATDKKSITPRLRVHLFNVATATLAADNAAYKELYADSSKRMGYFDMPAMTTATDSTNSDMSRTIDMNLRVPFKCADGSRSIHVVLEALDAFTPASGQKFNVTLITESD